MSLGNISKEVWKKKNAHAWLLLAKVPVAMFSKTQFLGSKTEQEAMPGILILSQHLFHMCMKCILLSLRVDERKYHVMLSPDGDSRLCMAVLMAWIADLQEQLHIVGMKNFSCPVCCARYDDLPEHRCFGVLMGNSIISTLKEIWATFPSASAYEFKSEAKKLQTDILGVIEDLCWEGLDIKPYIFIKQDVLHGIHKFIWDHPGAWLNNLLGAKELDHWFIAHPPPSTSDALLVVYQKYHKHQDESIVHTRNSSSWWLQVMKRPTIKWSTP